MRDFDTAYDRCGGTRSTMMVWRACTEEPSFATVVV